MHAFVHSPFGAIMVCAALARPAFGQWSVGAGLRAPRFSGAAVEQATGRSLRPYRPTVWEVGAERELRRVGIGLRVHYASSSLALEGRDALAAAKHALRVYGASPELALRLTHLGSDGVVRVFAGPLLEVWKVSELGSRVRLGLGASCGLEVPFGGRWSGSARVGAALTPASPFRQEELEEGLRPKVMWRREVSGALRYRL
jgi:hypothetical protein